MIDCFPQNGKACQVPFCGNEQHHKAGIRDTGTPQASRLELLKGARCDKIDRQQQALGALQASRGRLS